MSLKTKKIVVTRSKTQSAEFCQLLTDAGAEPIAFPVIEFEPLAVEPLHEALLTHQYDWLVFTSANAVEFYFAANPPPFAPARIAVVGAATLEALETQGYYADFVPETFTGEALAQGLGYLQKKRILLPRSKSGRPEITQLLRAQSAVVNDLWLYETVQGVVSAEQLAEIQTADAITFTSPSSVRNCLALVGENGLPSGAVVACIGPSTADEARELGLEVAVMPENYTIPDMVTALENYWTE